MKLDLYMNYVPIVNAALETQFDRRVQGLEHVTDEPTMFVINHPSTADPLLVAAEYAKHTGKPLRFGAKSEYFEGGGIDGHGKFGRTIKFFMESSHQIPVYREDNRRGLVELRRQATQAFQNGESVALHPEGSRSRDGRLNKYKAGAVRIAVANNVQILPVGIAFTHNPEQRRIIADIMFDEPMTAAEYNSLTEGVVSVGDKANIISDELEQRTVTLTGQERSGEFAVIHSTQSPLAED